MKIILILVVLFLASCSATKNHSSSKYRGGDATECPDAYYAAQKHKKR